MEEENESDDEEDDEMEEEVEDKNEDKKKALKKINDKKSKNSRTISAEEKALAGVKNPTIKKRKDSKT